MSSTHIRNPGASTSTVLLTSGDNEHFVAVSPPHKGTVRARKVIDGRVVNTEGSVPLPYESFLKHGRPALIQSDNVTIASCHRIGSKGTFHLRFGYVASDEAPPEDVERGMFDEADVREWRSIMENGV